MSPAGSVRAGDHETADMEEVLAQIDAERGGASRGLLRMVIGFSLRHRTLAPSR